MAPRAPSSQTGLRLRTRRAAAVPRTFAALPAPGEAEVWIFEVQYRFQDQPFGQVSQPLHLMVRG